MSATAEGPLAGTVVLDLSRALAGPHATMMLADMGARVIKIESVTGDDSRGWGPPFVQLPASPLRLERLDGQPAGRCRHQHPPLLGEHDAAVREWAHGAS